MPDKSKYEQKNYSNMSNKNAFSERFTRLETIYSHEIHSDILCFVESLSFLPTLSFYVFQLYT